MHNILRLSDPKEKKTKKTQKNSDGSKQKGSSICLKAKGELDFMGIFFPSFGESPVNNPCDFHYTESSEWKGQCQTVPQEMQLPWLACFCKIITNAHLHPCQTTAQQLGMHLLCKTLTKIGGLFICCLSSAHAGIIPLLFHSFALTCWHWASNKKTNWGELDEQQLKFLDVAHHHVK